MKDLRFSGTVSGTDVDITYRTDLISSDGEQFNVSQIQVGPTFELSDYSDSDHVRIFGEFKRVNYSLTEFKEFAEDKNLTLTIADSTGANVETLVEADESVSVSVSAS